MENKSQILRHSVGIVILSHIQRGLNLSDFFYAGYVWFLHYSYNLFQKLFRQLSANIFVINFYIYISHNNSLTENSNEFSNQNINAHTDISLGPQKYDHRGLTHWGRVMHICVSKMSVIGSDNGLVPGRHQANIWTNNGILLIGPLGTNFSEILIRIQTFSFKKMQLKMLSAKWHPFCLSLNELTHWGLVMHICVKELAHHWHR